MSGEPNYLSLRDLAYWNPERLTKPRLGHGRRLDIYNASARGHGYGANAASIARRLRLPPP
jgi:hypothetical protein